jgi:hypothetical protein
MIGADLENQPPTPERLGKFTGYAMKALQADLDWPDKSGLKVVASGKDGNGLNTIWVREVSGQGRTKFLTVKVVPKPESHIGLCFRVSSSYAGEAVSQTTDVPGDEYPGLASKVKHLAAGMH